METHRQNGAVGAGLGADDHLRALPRWGEFRAARLGFGFIDAQAHAAHGAADRGVGFLRRELTDRLFGRQFHVDAETVRIASGFGQQERVRVRDGFQVDVAAEAVRFPQDTGDADHLFHGVVWIFDDAGGQEQAFDAVAAGRSRG